MQRLRLSSASGLAVLVFATLALSHELIYVVAHGAGDGLRVAMSEAGHDAYWANFVLVVAIVCSVLLTVGLSQLRRLSRLAAASNVGALRVRDESVGRLAHLLLPLWGRVALLTTVAFLLQENIETVSIGHAAPGLGAIAGQHEAALPLIVMVSFVVTLVRALVRWRRDILLARLQHLGFPHRSVHPIARPIDVVLVPAMDGVRRNGVRGPPRRDVLPA